MTFYEGINLELDNKNGARTQQDHIGSAQTTRYLILQDNEPFLKLRLFQLLLEQAYLLPPGSWLINLESGKTTFFYIEPVPEVEIADRGSR